MKNDFILCASEEGIHQVAYTEWGNASKAPTIICVHGLARNRHDFDSLSAFLSAKNRHVFCPDIVGRGDSSWFKNPKYYNFEQYVADMITLIARTADHEIDWIGTSMGGLIGMFLAAIPNSPIRRLILNDVGPQIPLQALWHLGKYAAKEPKFASKEEAKAYYKKIYADFGNLSEEQWNTFTENSIREFAPNVYIAKTDPGINDSKAGWQFMRELIHNPHKALEGVFFDVDLWDNWRKVQCPVLVIRGQRSDLLLPEHIRKMQRIHPQTELFEVEQAGHAPALLELLQQEKIAAWLRESPGSEPS